MVSRIRWLAIPAVVAAAAACGSSALPAGRIIGVESPGPIGYIGEDRVLRVVGENFSEGIIANASNPDDSRVDRPRISLSLPGGTTPILVQGTFLGPTVFEGTIPDNIAPGLYDVLLENGDGEEDLLTDAMQLGFRAVALEALGPDAEAVSGTANNVGFEMKLVATDGVTPAIWKADLNLTVMFDSSDATLSVSPTFSITRGDTFGPGPMLVIDSAAELVTVSVDGLPTTDGGIALNPSTKQIEFFPGPAVRARLLPAAELNLSDDFVDTSFQIEDQWKNPATTHAPYSANFQDPPGGCQGNAIVSPLTVVVASNQGPVPVRIDCAFDDASVTFSENTSTGYEVGITFFDFN